MYEYVRRIPFRNLSWACMGEDLHSFSTEPFSLGVLAMVTRPTSLPFSYHVTETAGLVGRPSTINVFGRGE